MQALAHSIRLLRGGGERSSPPPAAGSGRARALPTLAVAIELGLLVLLIQRFQIEGDAFLRVALLAWVGFMIHSLLPASRRLPFFAALSLTGIAIVLGVGSGLWLVGLGGFLILLCHLPISFYSRVAMLVLAGALLAYLRTDRIDVPWSSVLWPILGSMFMFRTIVYMYDLRHEKEPASVSRTISYFFMLPNVCFPLFPVVDYKTFRRTYFEGDAFRGYQVGVRWIFRGIVHLLVYRIVYYHFTLDPSEIAGPGALARFLLTNFLLYLRVSGQFHMIVGILRLFGFNLPETHHYYYLASSFTDFWRRINIYWKDFMMKVFYYPLFFLLRRYGTNLALITATVAVFSMTWLLHSYQWFWLLGTFPLTAQDMLFWGILAALVLANTLHEAKYGRRRILSSRRWGSLGNAKLILQTVGTFAAICLLWSLWTSESLAEWGSLWRGVHVRFADLFPLAAAFLILAAVSGESRRKALESRESSNGARTGGAFRSVLSMLIPMLLLLALSLPSVYERFGETVSERFGTLRTSRLNRRDTELLERGYYEQLLGVNRINSELSKVYMQEPKWPRFLKSEAARERADFLGVELVPGAKIDFHGARLEVNRWGMRDRDYEMGKPPSTYRIAVLGSSHTMGSGVEDYETFENLLEDEWNREARSDPFEKIEILNFAVAGHTPLQQMAMLSERVWLFEPNAVFYVAHPSDRDRVSTRLGELNANDIDLRHDFLRGVVEQAEIEPGASKIMAAARLALHGYGAKILGWAYGQMVRECVERGALPILVLLPSVEEEEGEEIDELIRIGEEAGFVVVDLRDVYRDHDVSGLWVAGRDHHPNDEGHRLIAEELSRAIRSADLLPLTFEGNADSQ